MKPLVLASTSPYRKALLEQIGLPFVTATPKFEEIAEPGWTPRETALAFAIGKARSLGADFSHALIVGSDQVPALQGRILRKPETEDNAIRQLLELSGQVHELITSVALFEPESNRLVHETLVHQMKMRTLTPQQARDYVIRDRPEHCAGSYRIESLGAALFESMSGMDHTGIVGLPVSVLGNLMDRLNDNWLSRVLPK